MLWTLHSHSSGSLRLGISRISCRSFSFTRNRQLPRLLPRRDHQPAPPSVPSFRQEIAREQEGEIVKSFSEQVKRPSVRNQVLFFAFGSFVAFGLAARQTNEDTYYWSNKLSEPGSTWGSRAPNNDELRRARYYELGRKLQTGFTRVKLVIEEWPQTIKSLISLGYVQVAQPLLDNSEGKRVCYTIGAVNALVWLAWQIPRLKPLMMRSFTHSPLSGLSYTMLTSVFSHSSFFHFLFNSMALASFGTSACLYLTKEQQSNPTNLRESTVKWHFLAFFISAGLFSALASHVVSARITFPRLVSHLSSSVSTVVRSTASGAAKSASASASASAAKEASSTILPSLGASGAIYATVTLTAMAFPDTAISLIFPPTPPIPIQYGVFGLMSLDILGALRGWRVFDHYAHLGGAVFGILYYAYGPQVWEFFRHRTLGSLPSSLRKV